MAGGQERILRRRIGSIDATKKITRAMELIAASRIVNGTGRCAADRLLRVATRVQQCGRRYEALGVREGVVRQDAARAQGPDQEGRRVRQRVRRRVYRGTRGRLFQASPCGPRPTKDSQWSTAFAS